MAVRRSTTRIFFRNCKNDIVVIKYLWENNLKHDTPLELFQMAYMSMSNFNCTIFFLTLWHNLDSFHSVGFTLEMLHCDLDWSSMLFGQIKLKICNLCLFWIGFDGVNYPSGSYMDTLYSWTVN